MCFFSLEILFFFRPVAKLEILCDLQKPSDIVKTQPPMAGRGWRCNDDAHAHWRACTRGQFPMSRIEASNFLWGIVVLQIVVPPDVLWFSMLLKGLKGKKSFLLQIFLGGLLWFDPSSCALLVHRSKFFSGTIIWYVHSHENQEA